MPKIAQTKYAIADLIKKRWSPRSFSNQVIAEEDLFSLFEAATWAASSRNEQPWRFIYGVKGIDEGYNKIFSSLAEWNQKWTKSAPILAIGLVKTHSDHKNLFNKYAYYDLGQAMANLAIQAISKNIYIHQIGGFDKEMVQKNFKISSDYDPFIAFAIGYLGNSGDLPMEFRELEEKERSRFNLNKILFRDEF